MDPNNVFVTLLTAPTVLWLFVRVAAIVRKHQKHIAFYLRQSIATATSPSSDPVKPRSSIALAAHIILGLLLLIFAPYLAYLCVPPPPRETPTFEKIAETPLTALGVALVLLNASVLWLVPHPTRHEGYGCSQRVHVKAWACLVVPAVEFSAMSLAALGVTVSSQLLRFILVLLSVVLYVFSAAACFNELSRSLTPWEDTLWGKAILQYAPRGPIQKSKLLQSYVGGPPEVSDVILVCFLIPAILSIIQNASIIFNWAVRPRRVPPSQEMFFVLFSLYSTLTMSAGFFTQAQLGFERGNASAKGDVHQIRRLNYILAMEVFLTQALPLFVLLLGPQWTGHESTLQYNIDWFFWTSSVSHD